METITACAGERVPVVGEVDLQTMSAYLLTAITAFTAGFFAACLLRAGRLHDDARGAGLLAQTLDEFAEQYADRSCDVGGRVSVARAQLDRLDGALETQRQLSL